MCVRVCPRARALRIVSMDKILCFTNTFIIIIIKFNMHGYPCFDVSAVYMRGYPCFDGYTVYMHGYPCFDVSVVYMHGYPCFDMSVLRMPLYLCGVSVYDM